MGWVRLAESLSAPASARVGWTESNKHMKAKGKNPLAFFHFVNPPLKGREKTLTPLEIVAQGNPRSMLHSTVGVYLQHGGI